MQDVYIHLLKLGQVVRNVRCIHSFTKARTGCKECKMYTFINVFTKV